VVRRLRPLASLRLAALLAALLSAPALRAEDVDATAEPSEEVAIQAPETNEATAGAAQEMDGVTPSPARETERGPTIRWSATAIADFYVIDTEDAPDDVGGFFDQYHFTPNKDADLPFELGLSEASLDWIGDEDTPLLQIRFASPTSNLGLSGSEIDEPFFNQRLDAFGRRRGIFLDLFYRRFRTEALRIFPNTAGAPLVFQDRTDSSDRFSRERTGFATELRIRPAEVFDADPSGIVSHLAPELSFRGGYEDRDGLNQLVFLRSPTNDWLGVPQQMERSTSSLGGGLLVAPWGLVTLMLDFDHERFRWDSGPILEGGLGFPPPATLDTVAYVPNTDRSTGRVQLATRLGDRVRLTGGLQLTHLEQQDSLTPAQRATGLRDNSVTTYSANAAVDVQLLDGLSLETLFKFDRRNNGIDRDTPLFNPTNGTQIDEFVRNWRRFVVGGELVYHLPGANSVAVGARYEDVTRDIEFAQPAPTNRRIVPANALIAQDTRMATVYGRTVLRPFRGASLSGEVGYRDAPRTGYIVDLDDYVYGRLRAAYVLPLPRLVVASAFLNGSSGRNRDFDMVSGVGGQPAGPRLARNFDRSTLGGGITLTASPVDRLSLYASLFFEHDEQNHSLALSTLPRYFQDGVPIVFSNDGTTRYDSRATSLMLGGRLRIDERTDGSLHYTYTWTEARYGNGATGSPLRTVSSNRQIDSEIHGIHLALRRTLRAGLRVQLGYGLQIHDDHAPVPTSVASVVTPFDRSTLQHRVTVGITLTQALFADDHASGEAAPGVGPAVSD
jgi:hypothetical protein